MVWTACCAVRAACSGAIKSRPLNAGEAAAAQRPHLWGELVSGALVDWAGCRRRNEM